MRLKVILGMIGLFIIGVVAVFGGYVWFLSRQERVLTGTARPSFPYSDYSLEELNKLWPQYRENTAPTVQSPEQTHAKFIAALKKGDFDEAVNCCFRVGDREKEKAALQKVLDAGLLGTMINDLKQIDKDEMSDSRAMYSYRDTDGWGHIIKFIKTNQGIWLIESL